MGKAESDHKGTTSHREAAVSQSRSFHSHAEPHPHLRFLLRAGDDITSSVGGVAESAQPVPQVRAGGELVIAAVTRHLLGLTHRRDLLPPVGKPSSGMIRTSLALLSKG